VISNRDKAECARRECKQRGRVYPRLVAAGSMSAEFAQSQLEIMQAIAADYEAAAEAEEAKERLL
jgi:hypothetical protein